jgi:hypothetical protein
MKKKIATLILTPIIALALYGCAEPSDNAAIDTGELQTETINSETTSDTTQVSDSNTDESGLYIYLGGDDYTFYPYDETDTPEQLLNGIEQLTGWKLSLADEITTGKGGITVSFAKDSCLFVGPPEEQKDEFHLADSYQLTFAVLDSVQKTLQCWANPTNPDSVDIYFCEEGDLPLEPEGLGVTLPIDKPYSHDSLEALLQQ